MPCGFSLKLIWKLHLTHLTAERLLTTCEIWAANYSRPLLISIGCILDSTLRSRFWVSIFICLENVKDYLLPYFPTWIVCSFLLILFHMLYSIYRSEFSGHKGQGFLIGSSSYLEEPSYFSFSGFVADHVLNSRGF